MAIRKHLFLEKSILLFRISRREEHHTRYRVSTKVLKSSNLPLQNDEYFADKRTGYIHFDMLAPVEARCFTFDTQACSW